MPSARPIIRNGCVSDRDQNHDVDATVPSSTTTKFVADQDVFCPAAQFLPLTYNWSSVNSTINAMSPNGGTNQTVGLQWGWLSLLQQDPLNAPAENTTSVYQHVIILFTDGLNTGDRWYGNFSAQSSQVDTRMGTLCTNIKKSGVTIYTMQIDTDGAGQSAVLPQCASGSSYFYMLTSRAKSHPPSRRSGPRFPSCASPDKCPRRAPRKKPDLAAGLSIREAGKISVTA